jgi:spore germination protein GerM
VPARIAVVAPDDKVRMLARSIAPTAALPLAQELLDSLVLGPTAAERRTGFQSVIPADARLRAASIHDHVLTVNISGDIEETADQLPVIVGQIVLTATSLPGIRGVLLRDETHAVEAPLADGSLTSAVLTAADYASLLNSPG